MVAATQTTNTDRIQHASALKDAKNTEQAILAYQSVLNEPTTNDQVLREQEVALIHLGEIYRELHLSQELAILIRSSRAFMTCIAKSKTAKLLRSLTDMFESALARYTQELNNDPIIRTQLAALYDTLLEQNLVRIIEPFSRVEIAHIADIVKLPAQQVEQKLSQMILDKAFHGILDQGAGCLIIFDGPEEDKTYETAIDTLKQVDKVVSSLYQKAVKLS